MSPDDRKPDAATFATDPLGLDLPPHHKRLRVPDERPILYISGPYSPGHGRTVDENIGIAREYATRAWNLGWAAITPHLNTARFERDCDLRHEEWLAGDLSILAHLVPARSAILMLPNWQQSKGARLELQQARKRGILVYFATEIPDGVPNAPALGNCPFYRETWVQKRLRHLCRAPGTRCTAAGACPIRRDA